MKILHRIVCATLVFVLPLDPSTAASIAAPSDVVTPHLIGNQAELYQQEAVVAALTEFWSSLDRHARVSVRHLKRQFTKQADAESDNTPYGNGLIKSFEAGLQDAGFILKGDKAREELLRVVLGQSANQPAASEDAVPQNLFQTHDLRSRVDAVLKKRRDLGEDLRRQILQAVNDLSTKRKVSFRSIVLGSKNLPGQTDQFALGFSIPGQSFDGTHKEFAGVYEVPTLGYATDLISYLQFKDQGLKTTHLLDEYLLHEALEGYFDHVTCRILQKIIFPENYRFLSDEGVLRLALRAFVELRARQEPVPTLPYLDSQKMDLREFQQSLQAIWDENAPESNLAGKHFDYQLLPDGRVRLGAIAHLRYPQWVPDKSRAGAWVRVYLRPDPYRPGRVKWLTYSLADDGNTPLDPLDQALLDRTARSCFAPYGDLEQEHAEGVKKQMLRVLRAEAPIASLIGQEFVDTPVSRVGSINFGPVFQGHRVAVRVGNYYRDRKVRVKFYETWDKQLGLEIRSVEAALEGEPRRFRAELSAEKYTDELNFISPDYPPEQRHALEMEGRILSMLKGEIDEETLVGSHFIDVVGKG